MTNHFSDRDVEAVARGIDHTDWREYDHIIMCLATDRVAIEYETTYRSIMATGRRNPEEILEWFVENNMGLAHSLRVAQTALAAVADQFVDVDKMILAAIARAESVEANTAKP